MAIRTRSLLSPTFVAVCALLGATSTFAHPAFDPYDDTRFAPITRFGPSVGVEVVADGLTAPLKGVTAPGQPNRLYVVDQPGILWAIDLTTGAKSVFLNVGRTGLNRLVTLGVCGPNSFDERGLLGVAFHPNYQQNGLLYPYTSEPNSATLPATLPTFIPGTPDHQNVIAEWRVLTPGNPASMVAPGSRRELIRVSWPQFNHNGSDLAFGPDGKLYGIVGDAHDAANAQDLSDEDRGKIIRIKADGGVPGNNPFGDRVWAFGIRNSFGFDFNPDDGVLWETENGPACNDEVNVIRKGRNYGWGSDETCEGASPGNTNQDGPDPILPELFYESPVGITGIAFCDGCRLGRRSEGSAYFGAVNNGDVTRMILTDAGMGVERRGVVYDHGSSTLSFEVGPGGRIYFSDFDGIYKLVRR